MVSMRILPVTFYDRDAESVARELLGKLIVRRIGRCERIGRIVETEAYLGPHDLAAHRSAAGLRSTEVMFGPPGHAYVYMIYGMHHCLNVVTGPGSLASAVLLRALEPVSNMEAVASGPGRLCKALEIDRGLNGHNLAARGAHRHQRRILKLPSRSWPGPGLALTMLANGLRNPCGSTSSATGTSRES